MGDTFEVILVIESRGKHLESALSQMCRDLIGRARDLRIGEPAPEANALKLFSHFLTLEGGRC
jgi:hypothetical protein